MEVLSGTAAIVQFIDFASRIVKHGVEIHESSNGQLAEHRELQTVTSDLVRHANVLQKTVPQTSRRRLSEEELAQQDIANECQEVAAELLRILKKLTDARGRSRGPWRSFRQAIAAVREDSRIQALEKRLDRLRQQMVVIVLNSLRLQVEGLTENASQQRNMLDSLGKTQKSTHATSVTVGRMFLKDIREGEKWRRDLIQAIHTNGSQGQGNTSHLWRRDSNKTKHLDDNIRRVVLRSLRFRDMSHRERRIPQAYHDTFRWIYGSASNFPDRKSSFRDFLERDEQPLYWISGKPGSGKSTLMKYLRENEATRHHLRRWCGSKSRDCIFSSFYFWNSGTDMQMTVEGLLRTLLYECLQQLPSAIRHVLPERCEVFELIGEDDSPWELPELTEAFRRLILHASRGRKFFLMIDGLDECAGDQLQLIDLILKTQSLTSNLKVCVASRPWTNFSDAFAGRPHLRLEDVTGEDIRHYIDSRFNESQGFRELREREPKYAKRLLRDLSSKAQGVFLWVHLVTNSLLSGLANGDGIADLQRRLHALPDNLNDLFQKMLHSLDGAYLGHASRLFQLVRASGIQPSVFSLALADLESRSDVLRFRVRPFTRKEKLLYCANMKRKLMSRCRGLLEATSLPRDDESLPYDGDGVGDDMDGSTSCRCYEASCEATVQYLHRTVKDFIEEPRTWDWILSANEDGAFDPNSRWCESYLAQVKGQDPDCLTVGTLMSKVTWCMSYAAQSGLPDQTELMDELDRAAAALTLSPRRGGPPLMSRVDEFEEGDDEDGGAVHWTSLFVNWIPDASFTYLVAMCGMHDYLTYRLRFFHRPGLRGDVDDDDDDVSPLLLAATEDYVALHRFMGRRGLVWASPPLETIKVLLQAGESPYRRFRGRTMWTLAEAMLERQEPGYAEVLELYREHGGKPPRETRHGRSSPKSQKKDKNKAGLELSEFNLSHVPDVSRPKDPGSCAVHGSVNGEPFDNDIDLGYETRRRPRRGRGGRPCVVL